MSSDLLADGGGDRRRVVGGHSIETASGPFNLGVEGCRALLDRAVGSYRQDGDSSGHVANLSGLMVGMALPKEDGRASTACSPTDERRTLL
jgi:hypothetical protein